MRRDSIARSYRRSECVQSILWMMLKRGSSRPLLNRHRRGTRRWWLSPSRVQLEPGPPPGSRIQVPCDSGREGRDERWLRFAEQHVPSDAAARAVPSRLGHTLWRRGVNPVHNPVFQRCTAGRPGTSKAVFPHREIMHFEKIVLMNKWTSQTDGVHTRHT